MRLFRRVKSRHVAQRPRAAVGEGVVQAQLDVRVRVEHAPACASMPLVPPSSSSRRTRTPRSAACHSASNSSMPTWSSCQMKYCASIERCACGRHAPRARQRRRRRRAWHGCPTGPDGRPAAARRPWPMRVSAVSVKALESLRCCGGGRLAQPAVSATQAASSSARSARISRHARRAGVAHVRGQRGQHRVQRALHALEAGVRLVALDIGITRALDLDLQRMPLLGRPAVARDDLHALERVVARHAVAVLAQHAFDQRHQRLAGGAPVQVAQHEVGQRLDRQTQALVGIVGHRMHVQVPDRAEVGVAPRDGLVQRRVVGPVAALDALLHLGHRQLALVDRHLAQQPPDQADAELASSAPWPPRPARGRRAAPRRCRRAGGSGRCRRAGSSPPRRWRHARRIGIQPVDVQVLAAAQQLEGRAVAEVRRVGGAAVRRVDDDRQRVLRGAQHADGRAGFGVLAHGA